VRGLGIVLWFIFFSTISSLRAEFDCSADDEEGQLEPVALECVCFFPVVPFGVQDAHGWRDVSPISLLLLPWPLVLHYSSPVPYSVIGIISQYSATQ
jgi:hypothetical protein